MGKMNGGQCEVGKRTHAGSRFQWEKPYLNLRHPASGGYQYPIVKPAKSLRPGGGMRSSRRGIRGWVAVLVVVAAIGTVTAAGRGASAIRNQDLREWLTYIASDGRQGRAVFSAGMGLAAAYIEDHLRAWSLTPGGDHG